MTLAGRVDTRMTGWLGVPGQWHIEVWRMSLRVAESLGTGRPTSFALGNQCSEKGMHTRSCFNYNNEDSRSRGQSS